MTEDPNKVAPTTKSEGNDKLDDVIVKEKKTRKIQIDVTRDPEIEALQKELAELKTKQESDNKAWQEKEKTLTEEKKGIEEELTEKKNILEKQALEKFEVEKAAILKLCLDSGLDEDKIAEIEEKLAKPKNLELVKGLVNMLISVKAPPAPVQNDGKGERPTKKPQGKSTFTPPADAKTYEDERTMINELYKRVKNEKGQFTVQEQREAINMKTKLLDTLLKSKSWQQLREGISIGKHTIMNCPKCGYTIIGKVPDRCPKCNFNFTKTGDMSAGRG